MSLFPGNPLIFAENAPLYFAHGISVIPLEPYNAQIKSPGKKPIPYDWANWKDKPVPDELQRLWIQKYPWANIGIAAGPQSNLFFLDVDNQSPKILEIFQRLLPQSPWTRVGQKGFVAAYRWSPHIKNFKICDSEGATIIECLGAGNQAVIPPSIHPKTQNPYVANRPLLEVIHHLPVMPAELETILRQALQEAGFVLSHSGYSRMTDWVPVGARDNKMTSMAGMFSRDITVGRMTLQQALDRMGTWHDELVERNQKVAGDDIDISKGKQKIIEFLQADVLGEKKRPLPIGWDRELHPIVKEECSKIFTREHEEWTADDLKKNLLAQFSQFPGAQSPERVNAINTTLEKIARSPSLSNLDKETIYAYINQTSRIPGMTVSNLRKRVKEIQQDGISGANHHEIAEAVLERMAEYSGEVRFHNGSFWQWTGAQWEKFDEHIVVRNIAQQFGDLDSAKKYNDHKGIASLCKVLATKPLATGGIAGINFANGYLTYVKRDNEEGELRLLPHAADLGATATLPYRYMPELATWEKMPRFGRLLHDAWHLDPDYEQKVAALQEMIGATLFGWGTRIQRCVLLYKAANSGKSTLLNVIRGLLPVEATASCPPSQWNDKFAPATIADKLLNIAGELDDKKLIEGKIFKEVIDGTRMQGQLKGQQIFDFEPRATHWFGSNHLPKTTDTSEGFNRRWLILEFNKPISTEKKILGLHNLIIWEEREAIAAWAASAIPRLDTKKEPTLPPSHERAVVDMSAENNSVRFFFNRCARVLTMKKVLLLSERARSGTLNGAFIPSAPQMGNPSGGAKVHIDLIKEPAAFEIWAARIENHTSETTLFSEYISFCQREGGVKPVGPRAFKSRVKEMESDHLFTYLDGEEEAGDRGKCSGIVVGSISTGG